MNVILEKARPDDVKDIVTLINQAYRGDVGWTKETEIVDGNRTDEATIQALIEEPNIHFLVSYNRGDILACICIEQEQKVATIGFFSVRPSLQGVGIGKSVLDQAESYCYQQLKVTKTRMLVVNQRTELIEYYQRRGYELTGTVIPYPKNTNSGTPKIKGLRVEYLEKILGS